MFCGASPEKLFGYGPGPLGVSISESSIMSAGASYSCSILMLENEKKNTEMVLLTELLNVVLERRGRVIWTVVADSRGAAGHHVSPGSRVHRGHWAKL